MRLVHASSNDGLVEVTIYDPDCPRGEDTVVEHLRDFGVEVDRVDVDIEVDMPASFTPCEDTPYVKEQ